MDHGICRERIKDRKCDYRQLVCFFARLVKIISEVEACDTGFEQKDEKESVKYPRLREKCDDIGEGACDIIGVYAHKFAAQGTAEGIYHRHLPVYGIAQRLVKVNILTVEVEDEHRAVAERVYLHGEIYDIVQHNGDKKRVYEI